MVAQRREGVVGGVARPHLPQQADGVADRLGLWGVQRALQEVLRRAVVALLQRGEGGPQRIVGEMSEMDSTYINWYS